MRKTRTTAKALESAVPSETPLASGNGRRSSLPFLNLSPERFTRFIAGLEEVVAEENAKPLRKWQLTLRIEARDEEGRPLKAIVYQSTASKPWGVFRRMSLQVSSGWLLAILKRHPRTAEFFRGYPR